MFYQELKPNNTKRQSFRRRTVLAGMAAAALAAVVWFGLGLVSAVPEARASAGWAAGKFGKTYDFNGQFYVDAGSVYNGVKTVAFWTKGTTYNGKLIDLNGTDYISISGAGVVSATGFVSPTIYVDGVAGATVDANWRYVVITTGTAINASAVKFGSVEMNNLAGMLDDVKMFNYALSLREINEKYRQGSPSAAQGGAINDNSAYTALTIQQSGTGDILNLLDGTTNVFVVKDGGNVGIGDTSPAALFTVGTSDAFQVSSSGAIAAVVGITNSGNLTFSGAAPAISASTAATDISFDAGTTGKIKIGGTSTGDIDFAGGSGSTGCTITTAGVLTCSGNITGPTTGTVGYWARDNGTSTLSQGTANDNLSLGSGTITTTGTISSGLINGQTISSFANFTGTVTAATSFLAPTFDTATAVALNIGNTNQNALTLGRVGAGTTVTGSTLTLHGAATLDNTFGITYGGVSAALTVTQSGTGAIINLTNTASATTDAFTLTNLGSGNSFIVNDSATDATPFVIDASGNVGIGTTDLTGSKFKISLDNSSSDITDSYNDQSKIASAGDTNVLSGKLQLLGCGLYSVVGIDSVTYGTILGADGKCWLDRNLGATQVAASSTDTNSYGWYYQWGRLFDGHQIGTSGTTSTNSSGDVPGHANFITEGLSPYDWRVPQNGGLWQGVSGINNPCPSGFRLPTQPEWATLVSAASITNSATAYSSSLKLPVAGGRDGSSAALYGRGSSGNYWSSSPYGASAYYLYFSASSVLPANSYYRAYGFSVRCVKD